MQKLYHLFEQCLRFGFFRMLNKTLIAVLAASVMLTGCFKKTPECGSSDVTGLVKDIATDAYKGAFKELNTPANKLEIPIYIASIGILPSGNNAKKQVDFLKFVEKMIDNEDTFNKTLNEIVNPGKFEVSSVRTNSKNPDSKSVSCSAKLKWSTPFAGEIVQDVNYKAQFTDDRKEVYVEVESMQGFDEIFGFED